MTAASLSGFVLRVQGAEGGDDALVGFQHYHSGGKAEDDQGIA